VADFWTAGFHPMSLLVSVQIVQNPVQTGFDFFIHGFLFRYFLNVWLGAWVVWVELARKFFDRFLLIFRFKYQGSDWIGDSVRFHRDEY
jgi:hypothetical protein